MSSIDKNPAAPAIVEDAVLKYLEGKGHNCIVDLYIIIILAIASTSPDKNSTTSTSSKMPFLPYWRQDRTFL
ncbi:hypothetical protein FSHL1_002409 [Fusarium sambucinum]